MRTAELIYGLTGQTVEFYPPESVTQVLGVPSSVTYSVYDGARSNDDTADFSGSATVDSVSTTLTASAGQAQSTRNTCVVSSTTGITKGLAYLLTNAQGQSEVVEPLAINTSTNTITFPADLQYDYASGATFKGLRCVFTVDATWVATESNITDPSDVSYRIVWQYTVASVVRKAESYLRLVRKPWKHTVTPQKLDDSWLSVLLKEPRGSRGERWQRTIRAAEDCLRTDIIAEGYRPEQLKDTEVVDQLLMLRIEYEIARKYGPPAGRDAEAFIDEARKEYADLFTKCITVLKVSIDQGGEGATTPEPIQRYFFQR